MQQYGGFENFTHVILSKTHTHTHTQKENQKLIHGKTPSHSI